MQHPPLLGRHREGEVEAAGELARVVRVDSHAARAERLRGACKLGEHQHALGGLLASDVLVAHEVHAVAQRGDDARGRGVVERGELGKVDGLVEVLDGRVAGRAETAVDATDELVRRGAQLLVLWHLRHRHTGESAPPLAGRRYGGLKQRRVSAQAGDHRRRSDCTGPIARVRTPAGALGRTSVRVGTAICSSTTRPMYCGCVSSSVSIARSLCGMPLM
mmetsp:Transcript_21912/g.69954  ORF Transcript_21912/g.69954 Transcript_21912/m.69954 type:complete len:219 (-) Transcript_21912:258-914(-)